MSKTVERESEKGTEKPLIPATEKASVPPTEKASLPSPDDCEKSSTKHLSKRKMRATANGHRTIPLNVPKPTKYQLLFPHVFEQILTPLDNFMSRVCQKRTGGLLHSFVMSLTFFSAIEISLTSPVTLYALGYDRAAALCGSVLLTLCVLSQIPKKFIFRPRPWMSGRALPIRQDKTSSFPSRAVVCAVVFSWLIGQSLYLEEILPGRLLPVRLWSGIVVCSALTAFARINVGAHYASDTIFGFLLGIVVIKLGMRVEGFWESAGCSIAQAYPSGPDQLLSGISAITRAPLRRLVFAIVVAYVMTLVSIQGFWVKCSYVYGLLLAATTFRGVFSCAGQSPMVPVGAVAQVLDHGDLRTHLKAIFYFMAFLLFGMATRGNKGYFRIVAFTIIYFGSLCGVIYWRLR